MSASREPSGLSCTSPHGGGAHDEASGRTAQRAGRHNRRPTKFLVVIGLLIAALPAGAQDRALVPVTIDGAPVKLATITYKPAGSGPFPTLIFHHGSTGRGTDPAAFARPYEPVPLIKWFTDRGWAVILPSRRGRGGSEGLYEEGISIHRSLGYSCEETLALPGADRALRDIDAITPVLLAQPFVDRGRVAIGG